MITWCILLSSNHRVYVSQYIGFIVVLHFFCLLEMVLKWEAEDIVSKIRVSLEVNTKYFFNLIYSGFFYMTFSGGHSGNTS